MMTSMYRVEAFWDDEAQVWVAESEEIAGLVTEAPSLEVLTAKLKQLIPEMLVLNYEHQKSSVTMAKSFLTEYKSLKRS